MEKTEMLKNKPAYLGLSILCRDFNIMYEFLVLLCKAKIWWKSKLEDYNNCLEATQLENKTNHLEKNKIDIDRIKENHKEFIRNNKSIFRT